MIYQFVHMSPEFLDKPQENARIMPLECLGYYSCHGFLLNFSPFLISSDPPCCRGAVETRKSWGPKFLRSIPERVASGGILVAWKCSWHQQANRPPDSHDIPICLVVTGTMEFWITFPSYWEWKIVKIIPTDELTPSFFRGVGQPPTRLLWTIINHTITININDILIVYYQPMVGWNHQPE